MYTIIVIQLIYHSKDKSIKWKEKSVLFFFTKLSVTQCPLIMGYPLIRCPSEHMQIRKECSF